MDRFQNQPSDILSLVKLVPQSYGKTYCNENKVWCCAFSPDESYFAWSSSSSTITIVPWKNFRSLVYSSQLSPATEIKLDLKDLKKSNFSNGTSIILTASSVRSLAFGSWEYNSDSSAFWKRFIGSNSLLLAAGLVSGNILILDAITGRLLLPLNDHSDIVTSVSFSPTDSSLLASTSYDGTLKLWDLSVDGNLFKTLKMNGMPIYSCCWSPDGKTLVTVGMSNLVHVWNMLSYSLKMQLKGHKHGVVACAFSPDSCLIATASWDTHFILWNASTGDVLNVFCHVYPSPSHIYASGENGTWIRDISFSRDGAHVTTIADDGFLRLWDIDSNDNPEAISPMDGGFCCSFAPHGQTLAVGNKDGTVSFMRPKACVKSLLFLCRTAVRTFFDANAIENLPLPGRVIQYLKYN